MAGRRLRLALLGVCALLLAGGAGVAAIVLHERGEESELGVEPEFPSALGRHLDKLIEAIPGNGGEPAEGPGAGQDQEFLARAYPDDTVSVQEMQAARAAFTSAEKRPFKGKAKPGEWATIGPSPATYPFTELRNSSSYVPNAYDAGGRTTSIAMRTTCVPGDCRTWITPAGGGVWRTNDALAATPKWTYLGGPLGINAAGRVYLDPNDPEQNTIYVGTGEANICGSGCVAGTGLYKSQNGGNTWTGPLGQGELGGKGIGSIVVKAGDPNTIYVGTTTALRGMSSVCCSGVTRPVPGAAKWGLYKSTDGGATFTFIHNGSANASDCTGSLTEFSNAGICSPRGVRNVVLDPTDPNIVYASSFARGVWRSSDGGATWVQIKPSLNSAIIQTRPNIAVTTLPNGKTRMYLAEGNVGSPYSRLFRSDDVRTGSPVFTDLTSSSTADPGYGTFNFCTGQCWYDSFVYTPNGYPDIVYVGGSYQYGETGGISNGRAVVLSTDAGVTSTDMTMDATDPVHPNGLHPDQHFLLTNPSNPYQFFEGNDGGVMRSSGSFADRSSWCNSRGLSGTTLSRCQQLLSKIPTELTGLNTTLTTLQFQSLSVSPADAKELQGGTQDNGTWENYGSTGQWLNTMIGDGGQSGFDVSDTSFRFHSFFDASPDVNFSNGAMADWNWISDPIFGTGGQFYSPIISDPVTSRTMFVGTSNAWRTKTHGMGAMSLADFRKHCNEWTGDFTVTCGDWVQIASPSLTSATLGDRAGGSVVAVERTNADASTLWAATQTGRVFISKNANAEPASSVTWTRLDDDTAVDPNRFVSSIYVDPANGNHAWISYLGFNVATPSTPGHVFEVTYDPGAGTSTWVDRSYDLLDLPITDLVRDDVTGDLYAASDFGVVRLAAGTNSWTLAAPGMPNVEVAGLTIVPSARLLYAASHGLGAWRLNLP